MNPGQEILPQKRTKIAKKGSIKNLFLRLLRLFAAKNFCFCFSQTQVI